jgi:hypothetical protein
LNEEIAVELHVFDDHDFFHGASLESAGIQSLE